MSAGVPEALLLWPLQHWETEGFPAAVVEGATSIPPTAGTWTVILDRN
jgi:hypothetical protein